MAEMLSLKSRKRVKQSSEISVFVREAKSRDKKKVYKRVIQDAIREQNDIVKKAGRLTL